MSCIELRKSEFWGGKLTQCLICSASTHHTVLRVNFYLSLYLAEEWAKPNTLSHTQLCHRGDLQLQMLILCQTQVMGTLTALFYPHDHLTGPQSQIPWGISVPLLDPWVGKYIVGPRTFTTV